jgi:hypothetical protein
LVRAFHLLSYFWPEVTLNGNYTRFGFDCNQPVSKALAEYPTTMNVLIPRLEMAIRSWLYSHDEIHDLFKEPNRDQLSLTNLDGRYPYFGHEPWVLAILGGVQGVDVKIRNFIKTNDNCFEIEYLLSIVDTYGVDMSDATGFGLYIGLHNLWVLQHYRNYDLEYCPSTYKPCFRPMLDFHFTIRKKITYCRQ